MLKTPSKKCEKGNNTATKLYDLDRITIHKIQVNPSSVKHKNIRRGTIFGGPDTLTILHFDCNFSGNDSMCCH